MRNCIYDLKFSIIQKYLKDKLILLFINPFFMIDHIDLDLSSSLQSPIVRLILPSFLPRIFGNFEVGFFSFFNNNSSSL